MARFLDGQTFTRGNAAIGQLVINAAALERTLAFFVKEITGEEPKPGAARSVELVSRHLDQHHPAYSAEWLTISSGLATARRLRNLLAHNYVELASSINDEGVALLIVRQTILDEGERITLEEIEVVNVALLKDSQSALLLLANLGFKGEQSTEQDGG